MSDNLELCHTPLEYFIDICKLVFVALLIALVVRTFLVQPYYSPSESMLNTLHIGDRIFVCKFSYGIHLPFVSKEIFSTGEPEHGDIIVFPFPKDPKIDYIKRVIGLPGDTVELRDRQLYRNGEPVQEDYAIYTGSRYGGITNDMAPRTVPPGKILVMGDNRDNSEDSRVWGFVDKDTIQGKAFLIFWSSTDWIKIQWNRIGNLL